MRSIPTEYGTLSKTEKRKTKRPEEALSQVTKKREIVIVEVVSGLRGMEPG